MATDPVYAPVYAGSTLPCYLWSRDSIHVIARQMTMKQEEVIIMVRAEASIVISRGDLVIGNITWKALHMTASRAVKTGNLIT